MNPYQLFFTYRSAFENGQVRSLGEKRREGANGILRAAVESCDVFLLLGTARTGLLLSSVLLVSGASGLGRKLETKCGSDDGALLFSRWTGADSDVWWCSMRYSKMLEESAFRGRRADYVWFLLVSCTLLLVRPQRSLPPFTNSLYRSSPPSLPLHSSLLLSPSPCVLFSVLSISA